MAKTKKEIDKGIRKLEKEFLLESIEAVQNSTWILDSREAELRQMADCIKLLRIKKEDLYYRQLKAYHWYGEDILLVKEELLKDNVESDAVELAKKAKNISIQ